MRIEIHKKYFEEKGNSLLDTWDVPDTYPIPNVGDYVQGRDCWNEQVQWRIFDGKIIKLFVCKDSE